MLISQHIKSLIKLIVVLALWLGAVCSMSAQQAQYRHYTFLEGLPSNQLRSIRQLPDGRMLVICEGTFCIFDGAMFLPIECRLNNVYHLNSQNADTHYYTAKDGTWWITRMNTLYHFDPVRCRFLYDVEKKLKASKVADPLDNFFLDADGNAWLLTINQQIYLYNWQKKARHLKQSISPILDHSECISNVISMKDRYVIYYSTDCIEEFDKKSLQSLHRQQGILLPDGVTTVSINNQMSNTTYLKLDDYRFLLAGNTRYAQICLYDVRKHQHRLLYSDGYTSSLILSEDKRWLTTNSYDKLLTFDLSSLQTALKTPLQPLYCRNSFEVSSSGHSSLAMMLTDKILDLCQDRASGLWIATANKGLLYTSHLPNTIQTFNCGGETVKQIFPLTGGGLLLGTTSQTWIKQSGDRTVRLCSWPIPKAMCNSISRDGQGRIWVSTYKGLLCKDGEKMTVYNNGNVNGLDDNNFSFCQEIGEDTYLVCIRLIALGIFSPKTYTCKLLEDDDSLLFRSHYITSAIVDKRHQRAILTSQNGMLSFDLKKHSIQSYFKDDRWTDFSNKFNCQLLDSNGTLLLGTQNGLVVLHANGDTHRYTNKDGLTSNCIQGIIESSDHQYIWVSTSNGLNRIEQKALRGNGDISQHLLTFTCRDGLLEGENYERALTQLPDGSIAVGCTEGVSIIHNAQFTINKAECVPHLVGLSILGEEVDASGEFGTKTLFEDGFVASKGIELHYNENYLTLRFSSLDYAEPHQLRYRYRLEGSGQQWQYVESPNGVCQAIYTDIQPGKYTFCVEARCKDAKWSEPLRWYIIIQPPLWATWWAYVIYFILLVIAIVYAVRFYQQLRRKRMLLLLRIRLFGKRLTKLRHDEGNWIKLKDVEIVSEDEQWLERVIACIEEHIEDEEYTTTMLSRDVGVARTVLYRKMQQLTHTTPSDFIADIRLKRAAQLLVESGMSVQQVAYKVGFKTPRTFSARFKEKYGKLPKDYMVAAKEKNPDGEKYAGEN